MNIKSLLFGSAAALVAVSGARAADAVVVAEPEPAEYVRVCDVYGAGYFYIPGTETCLRIGGYLRYDAGFGDVGSFDGARAVDRRDGDSNDTWKKQARFEFRTWTGQETELGTLSTYTAIRFNYGNGDFSDPDNSLSINRAWLQLGGLRVGKTESAFDEFIGYAGNVIQDTLVPYGGFDTNVVQYYFDGGNGFSAMVSLEEGAGTSGGRDADYDYDPDYAPGVDGDGNFGLGNGSDAIDSYVPHVVVGAKFTQGWGAITAVGAYNSNFEEFAGKVRADVNVGDALSLFIIGGYGTDDHIDRNFYKQWGGNWAVFGGGTYKFNEKTSFNAQLSYDEDENFGVAANIAYEAVPGFTVTAEVDYLNIGDSHWTTNALDDEDDAIGGIIRFQRDF